ncbi:MAG TPA: RluA family pseudouridine synthase [Ruminiclostridium sp.]|jgi:23S rRNA pseudouridine1911/1915/1917 synthase|uniref:Pseudouridine synthase n=1 Tax=Acetivibrio saccincola TaxID=1677857 RepID=A0A2S8RD07_9FIRM|nr:RluA family pseudouridine synthase [Acetivibrio saccincola]HAA42435.1 RluA family pseudouridine synthase [Ruminiclostridium sp.]NLW25828.1 RluA family pseudouridine synthase [Acetivibrio saccincola]PQQ67687.1 RNA pseudouridine synthase [Acetivibrio saccincola]HOA98262.1 RluA family pseudouridine synthase [Acetivibrio saccincola]HQD28056.1 RluA family pseudouridine synthase [Acetivibrio saccincola]
MEEKVFYSEENGIRIDVWLSEKIGDLSRSYIQKLLKDKNVLVNGNAVKANYKIAEGDQVTVKIPKEKEPEIVAEDIEIQILYEDEDILVVNKPKGMVVHPAAGNYSGTLVNALMAYCGENLSDINGIMRLGIVHRIDKDTSGILLVAKNNTSHEILTERFKNHDIKRVYETVVHGVLREDFGKIDAPIGRHPVYRKKMAVNTKNGKRAVTHFKVIERFDNATYVEVTLETGRTHQIRVHMSHIGHPVIGDEVYGRKKEKYRIEGQALHAKVLGFVHPLKNKYMEFEAPLPEYFCELLKKIRG